MKVCSLKFMCTPSCDLTRVLESVMQCKDELGGSLKKDQHPLRQNHQA